MAWTVDALLLLHALLHLLARQRHAVVNLLSSVARLHPCLNVLWRRLKALLWLWGRGAKPADPATLAAVGFAAAVAMHRLGLRWVPHLPSDPLPFLRPPRAATKGPTTGKGNTTETTGGPTRTAKARPRRTSGPGATPTRGSRSTTASKTKSKGARRGSETCTR